MSFLPCEYQKQIIGEMQNIENHLIFFGNKNSSIDNLKERFPKLNFFQLKQVHGNLVVPANKTVPPTKADAQFSDQLNSALCISTADCIPILGFNKKFIFAAHAGWRGVQSGILSETLKHTEDATEFHIFFGPHIQPKSFEVNTELAQDFAAQWQNLYKSDPAEFLFNSPKNLPDKRLLNLARLVDLQLIHEKWNTKPIYKSKINTMTSLDYASFRDGRGKPARNISFVARLG